MSCTVQWWLNVWHMLYWYYIDLPYRTDVKCTLTFMTSSVSGWDGLITSTTPNIIQRWTLWYDDNYNPLLLIILLDWFPLFVWEDNSWLYKLLHLITDIVLINLKKWVSQYAAKQELLPPMLK